MAIGSGVVTVKEEPEDKDDSDEGRHEDIIIYIYFFVATVPVSNAIDAPV